jgi:hypothetical protein
LTRSTKDGAGHPRKQRGSSAADNSRLKEARLIW